MFTACIEMLES